MILRGPVGIQRRTQLGISNLEITSFFARQQPLVHRIEGFQTGLLPKNASATKAIVQMSLELPV